MHIRTRVTGEGTVVEVIDPTDGACTHTAHVADGHQVTVVATDTHSPAGIEFGEVEAIPEPEPEAEATEETTTETEDAPEGTDAPEGEDGEPAAA